jgi:hypothetical protein
MKNTHLLCCAAPFVIASYYIVRLIPQGLRALHLGIFDQPEIPNFFIFPSAG